MDRQALLSEPSGRKPGSGKKNTTKKKKQMSTLLGEGIKKQTLDQMANEGPKYQVKIELINLRVSLREDSSFRLYLRNQKLG